MPPLRDKRVQYVPVSCGRCMVCMKKRANNWRIRLLEEIKSAPNGKFVTFTFSNQSYKELYRELEIQGYTGYAMDNAIAGLAIHRFLERWRKWKGKSIRHWLVTELGHNGTENIHIHGIVWTDESKEQIAAKWHYGYVWCGYRNSDTYVNEQTVNYIVKYVHKQDLDHPSYIAKIFTSAGIGRSYINSHNFKHTRYVKGEELTYTTKTGHKVSLPNYYKDKALTDDEKEQLWIDKLDKGILWVGSNKIDMKRNPEAYHRVLEEERKKSLQLGFAPPDIDKNKIIKEVQRRIEQQKRRLQ